MPDLALASKAYHMHVHNPCTHRHVHINPTTAARAASLRISSWLSDRPANTVYGGTALLYSRFETCFDPIGAGTKIISNSEFATSYFEGKRRGAMLEVEVGWSRDTRPIFKPIQNVGPCFKSRYWPRDTAPILDPTYVWMGTCMTMHGVRGSRYGHTYCYEVHIAARVWLGRSCTCVYVRVCVGGGGERERERGGGVVCT